jgi:hypothetical protein
MINFTQIFQADFCRIPQKSFLFAKNKCENHKNQQNYFVVCTNYVALMLFCAKI